VLGATATLQGVGLAGVVAATVLILCLTLTTVPVCHKRRGARVSSEACKYRGGVLRTQRAKVEPAREWAKQEAAGGRGAAAPLQRAAFARDCLPLDLTLGARGRLTRPWSTGREQGFRRAASSNTARPRHGRRTRGHAPWRGWAAAWESTARHPRCRPSLGPTYTARRAFSVLTQIGRTFRIPSDYVREPVVGSVGARV